MNCSKTSAKPKLFLIGAGCHDASWLTLEAAEAIREADAIVYDDLIDRSILDLAPNALKISQGKRGHRPSAKQDEINALVLDLCKTHKRVVRLKGGDPMVFGRGMEEAELAREHGIDVHLIPGISSFLGIAEKEQLGLTLRNQARGFAVLTAMSADAPRTEEQWKALAGFEGTLVFMMGMAKIRSIADSLMSQGKPADTACAVIASTGSTQTESIYAPLSEIAERTQQAGLKSPGIIYIGGSIPEKPLIQLKKAALCVSPSLAGKIRRQLSSCWQCFSPLKLEYKPCSPAWISDFRNSQPDWLVFTSAYGTNLFFRQLQEEKIDLRLLAKTRLAVIGPATAAEFEKRGLFADLIPETFNSVSLAEALLKNSTENQSIWLMQNDQADPILEKTLQPLRKTSKIDLYTVECSVTPYLSADAVVFGSAQEIKAWKNAMSSALPVDSVLIANSQRTAGLLENCSTKPVLISKTPLAEDLAEALDSLIEK